MKIDQKKSFESENLITLLFGAWILVAPLLGGTIENYRGANVYIWNFEFVGLSVIFLSIMAIKRWAAWAEILNIVAGVWLLLSPLFLIYFNLSEFYFWNSVICGSVIAFFSTLATPFAENVHYHIHKKTKEDERKSISILNENRLHHHKI